MWKKQNRHQQTHHPLKSPRVRDLLIGLGGGLLVAAVAWITSFSKRKASQSKRVIAKATASHEANVEEVEEILEGKTPEEGLAALINERLK
jgi:hypothetical protein